MGCKVKSATPKKNYASYKNLIACLVKLCDYIFYNYDNHK